MFKSIVLLGTACLAQSSLTAALEAWNTAAYSAINSVSYNPCKGELSAALKTVESVYVSKKNGEEVSYFNAVFKGIEWT
jgi:hypothetical protein